MSHSELQSISDTAEGTASFNYFRFAPLEGKWKDKFATSSGDGRGDTIVRCTSASQQLTTFRINYSNEPLGKGSLWFQRSDGKLYRCFNHEGVMKAQNDHKEEYTIYKLNNAHGLIKMKNMKHDKWIQVNETNGNLGETGSDNDATVFKVTWIQ